MKKTLITSLLAASMAVFAAGASADTGTINFQGEITNSACSLGGGQLGTNMTIPLGLIATTYFTAVGQRSPLVDFDITLVGCDLTVAQNVGLSFAPGAGTVVGARLLSFENGGGATGAAIGIVDQVGANVIINGPAVNYPLVAGDNVLRFKAFYESTDATVTAGAANGTAIFTLVYS